MSAGRMFCTSNLLAWSQRWGNVSELWMQQQAMRSLPKL